MKRNVNFNVKSMAETFRMKRRQYGLTQEVISEKLGLTRPGYASMEIGRHVVTLSNLISIQEFYAKEYGDYKSLDWWVFQKDVAVASGRDRAIEKENENLKEKNGLLEKRVKDLERIVNLLDSDGVK